MLLVCYDLLNSQNIPISNSEKWFVTGIPLTQLKKKKTAEVAQKKEQ